MSKLIGVLYQNQLVIREVINYVFILIDFYLTFITNLYVNISTIANAISDAISLNHSCTIQ